MCSTCGQRAARLRKPGSSPRNPIMFGEQDGRAAQPATFLQTANGGTTGAYLYVAGDGVEQAIEDGVIAVGYDASAAAAPRLAPNRTTEPAKIGAFLVPIGGGRYQRFTSRTNAQRFARVRGVEVLTEADLLEGVSE